MKQMAIAISGWPVLAAITEVCAYTVSTLRHNVFNQNAPVIPVDRQGGIEVTAWTSENDLYNSKST